MPTPNRRRPEPREARLATVIPLRPRRPACAPRPHPYGGDAA